MYGTRAIWQCNPMPAPFSYGRCACVDYYAAVLPQLPEMAGAPLRALHGKMAPRVRSRTYEWFVAQARANTCRPNSGRARPAT